jgi:mannose-6-phosphate isomerase-like protein (cupin superfamily)
MEVINMGKFFVHLKDDGSVFSSTERFAESGYTASFFHLTEYEHSHPDYWELHPTSDELIFLIEGKLKGEIITTPAAELVSVKPDDIAQFDINQCQAVIIPEGHWHRLLLVEESKIMVIAKYDGTGHMAVG